MPHVITQSCCSDASCVYACPVNCIQPTPDDPDFLLAEMLHIDPAACVDCGACTSACPVNAIKPHSRLTEAEQPYLQINREYFEPRKPRPMLAPLVPRLVVRQAQEPLRVAIVGSGPAAMYAADEILTIPGATVDIYERLPQPYGLARLGVAPDHRLTRQVTRQLDLIAAQPGLRMHTGIEIGRDLTHADLTRDHHAVIYAVGAASDKRLELPGAELDGVASATEFVGWYNGHPDHASRTFDLSGERVVVIGNGNVALDVARVLSVDPESLAATDIAPYALEALRASRVREVVIVGRRGPEHSAFTLPELIGLAGTPGVQLTLDEHELDSLSVAAGASADERHKLELLRRLSQQPTDPARRQIRLRYRLSPSRFAAAGSDCPATQPGGRKQVTAVEFGPDLIEAGLVLTSIGYRGVPLPDLPFDHERGTIPHQLGRVIDPASGTTVPRTYVAGWIKRGPSGFIGTNRSCAQETVRALVYDWNAGLLRSQPDYDFESSRSSSQVASRLSGSSRSMVTS